MRTYVERTWGAWEPLLQRENHDQSFKTGTHQIILVSGERAGILASEDFGTHVQLEKLYLLPRFGNAGVGSQLLASLLRSAAIAGKPVLLRVLSANLSAQRFYVRHGFRITNTTAERVFMRADA